MKNTVSYIFQQVILPGFLAILILFGGAPSVGFGQETHQFLQVTDMTDFREQDPDIDGDWITFQGDYSSSELEFRSKSEIFVYHISEDELTNITEHLLLAERRAPRIDWPWVVWLDDRSGHKHVYAYNLETDAEFDLTPDVEGNQDYVDISGDKVVWVNHHPWGEFRKLMMYDLTLQEGAEEVPNVETFAAKTGVRIDGDDIVYKTYISGVGWELVHYSLAEGSPPRQITHFPHTDEEENVNYRPEIHDRKMIWVTNRVPGEFIPEDTTFTLYLYDLTDDTLRVIVPNIEVTDRAFTQKISYDIHENLIVWADRRDSEPTEANWNIYAYDLTTDTEHRVTENRAPQLHPDVYGGLIVAEDYRDCPGCATDFANPNIYAYHNSTFFRRGDSDGDGYVDVADPLHILFFTFLGQGVLNCRDASDADDNGVVDKEDAIHLLYYLFLAGEAPPFPGPIIPGPDLTPDNLGCAQYPLSLLP